MGSIRDGLGSGSSAWALCAVGALTLAAGVTLSGNAAARPGTHPITVSTWDARASSVALEYRRGLLDGGGMDVVSYHANFSSTGGRLSSQFGLFYLNFSEAARPTTYGLAGSATALFNLPVTSRFENGLPRAAIALYFGSVPTALISGERNYLSVPFVFGFGVPLSPAKAITITPWFELSPSVNLDTVIHPYDLSNENPADYYDPQTGTLKTITSEDVEKIVSKSVDLEFGFAVGARGGIDLALHASDYFDFTVNATMSSVGTAFSGTRVVYLGGGVVWRWDDIVPAVLPPEKRLLNESCEDVEARFRTCSRSREWRSPEQLPKFGPAQLKAPATPTANTAPAAAKPAAPAPAAVAPAPAPAAQPPAPAAPQASPAPSGGFPAQ
ncbi:MAG: hypothetical protein QM756_22840 [Polyangiaceae bacterium]